MIEIGKRSLFDFHGIKKNTPLLHHLAKGARRILPGMLCDQNALHLKTPFELHTHKVCSLQRRKGKNSIIILYTFLAEVYPNYMRLDHNSHHALSLELNSPINAFHVTAIMSCKRYTDREPLATRKVSHRLKQNPLYLKEISSERREKRCIPWHFEMKFAPGS